MSALRDRVAIAGIGYSALSRRPEESLATLTVAACDAALADAGLTRGDVDGLATSPTMPRYGGRKGTTDGVDIMSPRYLAERLGIQDSLSWVGATSQMVTFSFIDAVAAIASGLASTVVVYRSLHVPDGRYVSFDTAYATGPDQFTAPYGFSSPPAWAATVLRRYFELFGYSRADLAPFIAANRDNARRNPVAYWRDKPLDAEGYVGARMVADPMSILDCDLPVDGAAAIVLTSTERARDLARPPALVTGWATTAHTGPTGVYMNLEDLWTGGEQIAGRLWRSAGVGPHEIDTAQLYDGFSVFVPLWLESLGIVERGEGLSFLRDGHAGLTGRLPVNTGGGALGEGRLHGMTHLIEAAVQVTDRGGERQVPGASRSVVTVSNGIVGSTGFVISRDG